MNFKNCTKLHDVIYERPLSWIEIYFKFWIFKLRFKSILFFELSSDSFLKNDRNFWMRTHATFWLIFTRLKTVLKVDLYKQKLNLKLNWMAGLVNPNCNPFCIIGLRPKIHFKIRFGFGLSIMQYPVYNELSEYQTWIEVNSKGSFK